MTEPLRPMNLGEILDRTFQIYRSRFFVFVGIAALPALAVMGIQIVGLIGRFGPQPTFPFPYRDEFREVGAWLTSVDMESYFYCLIAPAITYGASCVFMNEKPTIIKGIQRCKDRWQGCLVMAAALWLMLFLLPALLTDPPAVRQASASLAASLAGGRRAEFLSLGAAFLFTARLIAECGMSVALSPSIPAWALEGLPVDSALRRGWRLATGSRLSIFGAWVLAAALQFILYALLALVSGLILGLVLRVSHRQDFYERAYELLAPFPGQVAAILVAPVFPIAITLFYYDQRIRKEGYDIERMMDAAGLIAPVPPPAGENPIASVAQEESKA